MKHEHARREKKTPVGLEPFLAPPDLIDDPQLAVVTVLKTALQMTASALLAAYPNMWSESEELPPIEDGCAVALVREIRSLEDTVDLYERILDHRLRPGNYPKRSD
jgi:hypothetical protein